MKLKTKMRVIDLNKQPYQETWLAMKRFTDARTPDTEDEIWLVEHDPVFTLGQAGKTEHILEKSDIPIVQSDRGGQVTYHGPGQIIAYILVDIKRLKLDIRTLVERLEKSVIDLLAELKIKAYGKRDAPGVYVNEEKIASIGLKIRKGCSFHGVSINVDMDLEPFSRINPCGYQGMEIVQLSSLMDANNAGNTHFSEKTSLIDLVAEILQTKLASSFGYETVSLANELPKI